MFFFFFDPSSSFVSFLAFSSHVYVFPKLPGAWLSHGHHWLQETVLSGLKYFCGVDRTFNLARPHFHIVLQKKSTVVEIIFKFSPKSKNPQMGGTWLAQLVEHATLDLRIVSYK